ncbi:hypothetical protein MRO53_22875 [Escherichia coli]|nr:hypothetical protein [Escherichia coli]
MSNIILGVTYCSIDMIFWFWGTPVLTEKQLFELIKALQSSNFSTMEIFWLSVTIIVATLMMSFLVSSITEKAKIAATNQNYRELHDQLTQNTNTIKNIEKTITSELWISQQVWQKKFEIYEFIYAQLLSIKKWVDNESSIVELHMLPKYIASGYNGHFSKEEEKIFWDEVAAAHEDIEKTLDKEEVKIKNKELQQKLSNAMTSLAEILITKSIILNPDVTTILTDLIDNIGANPSPLDYEEPDDYGSRIEGAIKKAINDLRLTALDDLEIKHKIH